MTVHHYFGGTGTSTLGKITQPDPTNSVVAYSNENQTRIYVDVALPSGTERIQFDYYYNNDFTYIGLQARGETVNAYTTGDLPLTFEENVNWNPDDKSGLLWKAYSTDDIIEGSSEGGSLQAWTFDSDDQIRLHTGSSNYVEAGNGNDYIQNWSWHANGIYTGGPGNDRFSVANGFIYGGTGADTFQIVPIYTDVNGINGPGVGEGDQVYVYVMDFEVGVDNVVGSGLPISYQVGSEGIFLRAENANYSMLIKDVFDVNQLNLTTS